MARYLAGRAKPLPSAKEQHQWERERVLARGGGKNYYSIAPDYETFFELLREIAGDPAPGTTGRTLPPFDKRWLSVWAGMTASKIAGWERKKQRAEDEERRRVKARL